MTDTVARRIADRYRLGQPLGRGGMGRVYRGYDDLLNRPVAVKLIYPDAVSDVDLQQACAIEARAAARISHPGIVRILDSGIDDGQCFVVMELADGQPLATILEQAGPLPIDRALGIAAQAADALHAAHAAGVVHCDVKPANLMVGDGDRVRLVDFGIARFVSGTTGLLDRTLQGSAKYVAPEQIEGGRIDGRTDVYALGIVLYEMLAGVTPFEGGSLSAVLGRRLVVDPPALGVHRTEVPGAVEEIVLRALARNPDDRFASASDFRDALCANLAAIPPTGPSPAPAHRPLRWLQPLDHQTAAQIRQMLGGAADRLPRIRYGAVGVLGAAVAVALSLSLGGRVGVESATAAAPAATAIVSERAAPPVPTAITPTPVASGLVAPQTGGAQPTSAPAPIPPYEPAPAAQPPVPTPDAPPSEVPTVPAAPIPAPSHEPSVADAVPQPPASKPDALAAPHQRQPSTGGLPRLEALKAEPPPPAPKPAAERPEKKQDEKPEKPSNEKKDEQSREHPAEKRVDKPEPRPEARPAAKPEAKPQAKKDEKPAKERGEQPKESGRGRKR